MTFGQRLRELRKAKGLTQIELAQRSAISFTYVSKLETGVMPPPKQKIILALAKALDINKTDTDKLFGLAKRIPSELIAHVDAGMIEMLRSLKHREETIAHESATLKRRITEPEASGPRSIRLKESPERQKDIFRAIVESSPDGIVILDSELGIIYENPAISRILGYESGEFSDKDTLGVIHPDDMSKAAHGLTEMIQTPADCTSIRAQLRVRHKDGTWRVIDAIANNLLHDPAVNGIIVDIREMSRQSWDEQARVEDSSASAVAKEYRLTQTERKVLNLIAEGLSNPQIAAKLVVSPSTVRFHVTSIFRKLGVTSRAAVAAIAVRRRLVT